MVFISRSFQLSPSAAERYSRRLIRFCLTCFSGGGQYRQTVGSAVFIVDGPMSLQASGALVEFFPVQETDAVDDQMAMQVVGVDVGSYQYLEVGELPLGQFQSNGVGLLGREDDPSLQRTWTKPGSTVACPFFETVLW